MSVYLSFDLYTSLHSSVYEREFDEGKVDGKQLGKSKYSFYLCPAQLPVRTLTGDTHTHMEKSRLIERAKQPWFRGSLHHILFYKTRGTDLSLLSRIKAHKCHPSSSLNEKTSQVKVNRMRCTVPIAELPKEDSPATTLCVRESWPRKFACYTSLLVPDTPSMLR